MRRNKGPWVVEESVQRYRSSWLEVCEDMVIRPDGKVGSFATVKMKPGVSVLALGQDEEVYLTSEYRYAVERDSIEVVSGAIDDDESPLSAAQRELREELGIAADQWIDLGAVDPFTSIVHSPANLFLARQLSFVEPAHEVTEIIKVVRVQLTEAVLMVMESEIRHGPSCVLILKAHYFLNSREAGA